ncbi:MAG: Ig-like domain-containing protein [Rikenellaceae bacterium]|jgi:hypothetical protein|nr:Ig-like domain-containing protein [Rikenellaceae bacterium]
MEKNAFRWLSGVFRAGLFVLVLAGIFSRCANVSGTLGGGPKDSLPPRIVRMTPAYNATGIRPAEVKIDFDEYIQLKDVQKEFFTSPFMEVRPVVSYKNKSAIVTIDSPLDSATTYVLNLGSSVVDNNESNPFHGLKYTFSTGDHIDSMFMSGYVSNALTADTAKGAYLFFYDAALATDPERDSLLYDTQRASAVARTLSDGGFIYSNLKPIDYRVYALMDKNSNQMYDPGVDEVAFSDSLHNPALMPSFLMWYDSVRMHTVAQPQIFLRTFTENPDRLQNLSGSSRPGAQQIILEFSSKNPVIERFTLDSIPPEAMWVEQPKESRDSVIYWLNVPPEELPDTLRGKISYLQSDSVGQLVPHEQELRLVWTRPKETAPAAKSDTAQVAPRRSFLEWLIDLFTCKKKSSTEATLAADSLALVQPLDSLGLLVDSLGQRVDSLGQLVDSLGQRIDSLGQPIDSLIVPMDTIPPSLMKFSFEGANPVIPGQMPVIQFDLPVRRFDRDSVVLYRLEAQTETAAENAGANSEAETAPVVEETGTPVEVTLEQDSLLIRRYTIHSEWEDGVNYRLFIPPGAIETIDGERNDSISQPFKVAKQADMASITLHLINPPADYLYIVQVMDEPGKQILRQADHLSGGSHEIGYLEKDKKVRLRLIEDRNGNGRWDTGNLIGRVQPEAIAWYLTEGEASDDSQAGTAGAKSGAKSSAAKGTLTLQGAVELDSINLTTLFLPRVHRETPPEESVSEEEVVAGEAEPEEATAEESTAEESTPADALNTPDQSVPASAVSSQARVEYIELTDPKAARRAERALRRAEKRLKKEERQTTVGEPTDHEHDHDHEHDPAESE